MMNDDTVWGKEVKSIRELIFLRYYTVTTINVILFYGCCDILIRIQKKTIAQQEGSSRIKDYEVTDYSV